MTLGLAVPLQVIDHLAGAEDLVLRGFIAGRGQFHRARQKAQRLFVGVFVRRAPSGQKRVMAFLFGDFGLTVMVGQVGVERRQIVGVQRFDGLARPRVQFPQPGAQLHRVDGIADQNVLE